MNFRECVIDCIAQDELIQSFNRLHDTQMSEELLAHLKSTKQGALPLANLDHDDQELLACFILFVHRHIWRKVQLAQSRVTMSADNTLVLDLSRLERASERHRLHG